MHCCRCRDVMLKLTPHEFNLLAMLAQGHDNSEIARITERKIKTIKNTLTSIYRKIELYDRLRVVVFLYQHRLIPICEAPLDDPYGRAEAYRQAEKNAAKG